MSFRNANTMHVGRGRAAPPVAIGGVGGSGTRIGAALLRLLGYEIGSDLNEALDNLWFTLLFKRRSVLLESSAEFRQLAELFFRRLGGSTTTSDRERTLVLRLANGERLQHPRDWLRERATSLLSGPPAGSDGPSGWKEPNTHVVIERLCAIEPELRYLHFVRNPLDMAYSANQNQLELWGPIYLERDVTLGPRDSLAYWCAAHRRVTAFMATRSDRTLLIDFDDLCADPARLQKAVAALLGLELTVEQAAAFGALVEPQPSRGRYKRFGTAPFDPADLAYAAGLGYAVDA